MSVIESAVATSTEILLAPEIRLHMPADRYHASPGLSISKLRRLARSPQHFKAEAGEQTSPMRLGTAAHCAVLEPERFERDYAVWDRRTDGGRAAPRNGKWWEAFCDKHAGQTIITIDEYTHAIAMQTAVRSDPVAHRYLASGAAEVSMRWYMHGRLCRGRPDWLTLIDGEPHLVGLKTARDCRLMPFSSQAARLGYHCSWSWYEAGYAAIRGMAPRMKEIVVESAAPYSVVVYDIPEDVILQGRDEYERLLEQLDVCERTGEWPGPGGGMEQTLSLPSWAYQTTDDISDIGLEV
jgi:exodeoxyribonuclease VIII